MARIHDDLTSLLAYLRWADERMLESLQRLSHEQYTAIPADGWSSVRSTVVHMADATNVWALRLTGQPVSRRRNEDEVPTLADAAALHAAGHDAMERALASKTADELDRIWTYRNMAGEEASVVLWAVFRHVVNHATYHRGQVASKLRLLGFDPPSTDLIYWAIDAAKLDV